jgi:aspartate dehydrogenase
VARTKLIEMITCELPRVGRQVMQTRDVSRFRVGLIGYGAIGQQVAAGIVAGLAGDVDLVSILTRNPRSRLSSADQPDPGLVDHDYLIRNTDRLDPRFAPTEMLTNFSDFLATRPSLVLEAASAAAVTSYAESIVSSGASLMLVSTAALVDIAFRRRLEVGCSTSGARIYIPAGAVAGLDALAAAAAGGLEEVTLRITEPRHGCARRRVVFQGFALEGARLFPARLNVAATVALTIDWNLEVELMEDSDHHPRTIELRARGAFGEFSARMEPDPKRDRLSHIVALSLLSTLRRIQQPIRIG